MDNKTKVKVAVVIAIVILAVIFIFMVIFVKGNRTPVNKNIPFKDANTSLSSLDGNNTNTNINDQEENPTSDETEDFISIGIKDNNIVKINSDFGYKVIKKIDGKDFNFCYGDNKIYIAYNKDNSCSISEIDLTNSSEEKEIFKSEDYNFINNLQYYGEKIYFVSGEGQLIEYSISEEYSNPLTNENEVSNFVIDKDKNCLYVSYKPNGENSGIYLLDFTTNSFTQIIALNDLTGELLLNGSSLVIDVIELGKIYVYNSEQNSVLEIGNDNLSKTSNHVTFYNDLILYTDGSKIDIKDNSGNSYQDSWYTLNDNLIASISMISSDKLQIARADEEGKISSSIIVDLLDGTTKEMPDTAYSQIVIIK